MASYLPPTEELPIFDNQVFDVANNSYLTFTEAKKYFVSFPIAQGTSTISDLIAGSISYLSPESGSFFNIGTNQVSGGTIRLGPTGASGVSVHAGNIDCYNNTINNATAPNTGNLTIGNSQTSGHLNLGTGTSRTIDGVINIGTGASSVCPINIGSSSTPINFNNDITLTSSNYITTTASASTVTAPSYPLQVGCVHNYTNITSTIPTSDFITSLASVTLTAGTWLLTACRQYNNSANTTRLIYSFGTNLRSNFNTPAASDYTYGIVSCFSSGTQQYASLTGIASITATGNTIVYLNILPTYTSAPSSGTTNFIFTATRIA